MSSIVDKQVIDTTAALMQQLESLLPADHGAMLWLYSKTGEQLEFTSFATHMDVSEKLCALTAARVSQQAATEHQDKMRRYTAPKSHEASELVISSAEVTTIGRHDLVRLWSREGFAGELVVSACDGARITSLLLLGQDKLMQELRELKAQRTRSEERGELATVTPGGTGSALAGTCVKAP
jgi:hypothetical protein